MRSSRRRYSSTCAWRKHQLLLTAAVTTMRTMSMMIDCHDGGDDECDRRASTEHGASQRADGRLGRKCRLDWRKRRDDQQTQHATAVTVAVAVAVGPRPCCAYSCYTNRNNVHDRPSMMMKNDPCASPRERAYHCRPPSTTTGPLLHRAPSRDWSALTGRAAAVRSARMIGWHPHGRRSSNACDLSDASRLRPASRVRGRNRWDVGGKWEGDHRT